MNCEGDGSAVTSSTLAGGCINSLIYSEGKLELGLEMQLLLPIVSEAILALRPSEIRLGMLETSELKVGKFSMSLRLWVSMFVLMWLCSFDSAGRRSIFTSLHNFSDDSGLMVSRMCDWDDWDFN